MCARALDAAVKLLSDLVGPFSPILGAVLGRGAPVEAALGGGGGAPRACPDRPLRSSATASVR